MKEHMPLDIKKKTDHLTFSRFSDFAFMYGGQAELEKLVSSCGGGTETLKRRQCGIFLAV